MNIKQILWILLLCWAGLLSAQQYRVGDVYMAPDGSRGIVYYLHPDGSGGWVVALHDQPHPSIGCVWGPNEDVPGIPNQEFSSSQRANLLYDTAGYANTQAIRTAFGGNGTYAAGLVDFENGWVLPSPAQLKKLFSQKPIIDPFITSAGGDVMTAINYWTSAEYSATKAWSVDGAHGGFSAMDKNGASLPRVRAVRSFTYEPTYLWNTGDTTASITVAPEQTTDYTVTVFSPVGCSNEDTQTVLVNSLDTTPVIITACESYTWKGVTYDTSGIYSEHYQNVNGCDSVVILYLTINNPIHQSINATGIESYLWNDSVYTQDGDYLFSHLDENGCMQVDTLHLTIYHGTMTQFDTTVCESDFPFEWGGVVFATAGTHVDTLYTFAGADSLVFWNLHVVNLPIITHSSDTAVLAGDSLTLWAVGSDIFTWTDGNGNPVGNGATVSIRPLTSGYYYVTGYSSGEIVGDDTSALQCSATDSIWVEVLPNPDTMLLTDSACVYYVWYGDTLTQSDVYYYTMTNWLGYDSVEVLTLTVFPTTYGTFDTTVVQNLLPVVYNDSIYPTEGTYTQVLTNAQGCDSLLEVNVLVHHNVTTEAFDTLCESQLPHLWNDSLFTEAGTKQTTLHAATGADSTVVMHLTVFPTTYGAVNLGVVENNLPFQYNDSVYEGEGTYIQYLTNVAGCDSILTVNVTVYENVENIADSTICESSLPFTWNDVTFTEAGSQPATLVASTGADSVLMMIVTVIPTTTFDTSVVACDSFTWRDSIYTASGDFVSNLTNAAGCDSVVTLHLTVRYSTTYVDEQNVCDSLRWIDGNLYTASTNEPTLTLMNAAGCDSVVTLHLTITNTDYIDYTDEVCDSLRWIDGNLYTESTNEPMFTLTNAAGCDSVVTLNLIVRHSTSGVDVHDVCDSLRWIDGTLYTESTNAPTYTLTNAAGCDSVVTLHLTVRHSTGTTINAEIVQNNLPYTLNDSIYTATGTYYQHFTNAAGCDSTVTLNLTVYNNTSAQVYNTVCASALPYTWGGHVFTEACTFTDTLLTGHGADSVVTYTLTVDNISTTIGNVDHILCYGDSTGFATAMVTGGQSPMTYAWTNTANTILSTTTSLSSVPAGFYTFTVTDVIGCTAVDTVTIISLFGEIDPGTISADQMVCSGEQPAPFIGTAATGSDHITYFWEFSSDGEIWSTAQGVYNTQNYTYPYPAPFSFFLHRLSIIQGCGIYYSNVVTVSVWPNTIDTVTGAVCQDEAFEGFGFEVTADQTVVPGEYAFEQHHATGHCDSVVVLILTVYPLFETEVEDEVCEGEGYEDNGFSIAPLETVGEQQLTRTQTLQSAAGCDSVVTLHLRVIDTAVRIVSLTPDFCEDLSAELMVVTDMPNYVWSTGETAPTITVTHSGRYYVTATSGECSSIANFTVENCDGNQLLLPNAITPSNGDGLNDYFSIPERNLHSINLFEIWIYNRWGELVYYSNDKNFKWNGEYRGQIQYQTVYNYVIRYTDAAGKPYFVKGSVTVL